MRKTRQLNRSKYPRTREDLLRGYRRNLPPPTHGQAPRTGWLRFHRLSLPTHYMKDFLALPVAVNCIAQIPLEPTAASWERLGIAGLSIFVTVFIWRYFTARETRAVKEALEEKRRHEEAANIERDRLLVLLNQSNQEVVELLKQAAINADNVARRLFESKVHAVIDNPKSNPVNTKPIP